LFELKEEATWLVFITSRGQLGLFVLRAISRFQSAIIGGYEIIWDALEYYQSPFINAPNLLMAIVLQYRLGIPHFPSSLANRSPTMFRTCICSRYQIWKRSSLFQPWKHRITNSPMHRAQAEACTVPLPGDCGNVKCLKSQTYC
jgi:hypothetical protein